MAAVGSDVNAILRSPRLLTKPQPAVCLVGFGGEDEPAVTGIQVLGGNQGTSAAGLAAANRAENQKPFARVPDPPYISLAIIFPKIDQGFGIQPFELFDILDFEKTRINPGRRGFERGNPFLRPLLFDLSRETFPCYVNLLRSLFRSRPLGFRLVFNGRSFLGCSRNDLSA